MLVITSGKRSLEQLKETEVKVENIKRKLGRSWAPISHAEIIDALHISAARREMELVKEDFSVTKDELELYGYMTFQPSKATLLLPAHCKLSMGILHSNSGRASLRFYVGASIETSPIPTGICMSTIRVMARQTIKCHENLSVIIDRAMQQFLEEGRQLRRFLHDLRHVEISDMEATWYVLEACRLGIVPRNYAVRIYERYKIPRYKEFIPRTLWSMYNSVMQLLVEGKAIPSTQLKALAGLPTIFFESEEEGDEEETD
jgi:hypothetical protein